MLLGHESGSEVDRRLQVPDAPSLQIRREQRENILMMSSSSIPVDFIWNDSRKAEITRRPTRSTAHLATTTGDLDRLFDNTKTDERIRSGRRRPTVPRWPFRLHICGRHRRPGCCWGRRWVLGEADIVSLFLQTSPALSVIFLSHIFNFALIFVQIVECLLSKKLISMAVMMKMTVTDRINGLANFNVGLFNNSADSKVSISFWFATLYLNMLKQYLIRFSFSLTRAAKVEELKISHKVR